MVNINSTKTPIALRGHHLGMLSVVIDPKRYAQLLIKAGYVEDEKHPFIKDSANFLEGIRADPSLPIRLILSGEDYICSICPYKKKSKCDTLDFKNNLLYGTPFWEDSFGTIAEEHDRRVIRQCGLENEIGQEVSAGQVLSNLVNLTKEQFKAINDFLDAPSEKG